jgi:Tetraspanin family
MPKITSEGSPAYSAAPTALCASGTDKPPLLFQICAEIKPTLQSRLADEYSSDADFTQVWDSLQRNARCCGVVGPRDFLPLMPPGGGGNNTTIVVPHSLHGWWGWSKEGDESVLVPQSCCRPVIVETTTAGSVLGSNESLLQSRQRCEVFSVGCEQHLVRWLRVNADLLFVIGFCVVAFVKLTFLGILHYEIREMIQKIKLMQQEREAFANSGADLTLANHYQALPTNLPPSPMHMNHVNRAPLLLNTAQAPPPQPPPPIAPVQLQQLNRFAPAHAQQQLLCTPPQLAKLPNHVRCEDGNNSDTGSHCALIILDCKPNYENNNKDKAARQTQI